MKHRFAVYVSSVAALGGLLFGYDTAVIAGTVEFLQKRFELTDIALGWTVSSALVGCLLGAWLAGGIGDRIGRKRSLLVGAVLFFISAVWSGIASSAGELAIARIVGGIGVGLTSMMTPVYIAEVSPARMRGSLTTLNQIAVLTGMVLVYLVNAQLAVVGDEAWRIASAWRWMITSGALPAVLFFGLLFAIPESPRWLVMKAREAEAATVLQRMGGDRNIDEQIAEIHRSFFKQEGCFSDCLRPPIRRIFSLGPGLPFCNRSPASVT
ncbi:MAG: MFS transporter [Verrucomicrobia bacterium]|nr:MFS transporter [Verrucomicrobiota bacterium]